MKVSCSVNKLRFEDRTARLEAGDMAASEHCILFF